MEGKSVTKPYFYTFTSQQQKISIGFGKALLTENEISTINNLDL